MRHLCFSEWKAIGSETEALVETDGVCLGMEMEGGGSLALRFGDGLLHDIPSEAAATFGSQHASHEPLSGLIGGEEACIGNHMPLAKQREVESTVVDVIHIEVSTVLFGIEDGETGFEHLV